MLTVLLVVLVYLALAALLFGVSRFIQGVFYTEVPTTLWWRALIAAGIIWLVALVIPLGLGQAGAPRWPITFDEMLMLNEADAKVSFFKELIVLDDSNRETRYRRVKAPNGLIEFRDEQQRPFPVTPPEILAVPDEGETVRLKVVKDPDGYIDRRTGGAVYQDSEGNRIPEASFYTGSTESTGYGSMLLALFGDVLIFLVWFLVLWLVMLFQWQHALLIALPAFFIWGLAMNLVV